MKLGKVYCTHTRIQKNKRYNWYFKCILKVFLVVEGNCFEKKIVKKTYSKLPKQQYTDLTTHSCRPGREKII